MTDVSERSSTARGPRLPFWWRVTRYDPALRDDRGRFSNTAWTSIGGIGQVFDGELLTEAAYLKVEEAYVAAFRAFARNSDESRFTARSVQHALDLREGQVVGLTRASIIVRALLRGEFDCVLEGTGGRFAVDVGYDLYIYIGSRARCSRAQTSAAESGLFVEEIDISPRFRAR